MTTKLTRPAAGSDRETWLTYIDQLHQLRIDLGLERMQTMVARLGLDFSKTLVLTVGGTNGKGSSVTFLERLCRAAGLKTGLHMSPHLLDFNERCRLNGECVADGPLIAAFEKIEAVRGDLSLSFFEYTLLAFFVIFADEKVDALILEVGLGGRLDATNVLDADGAEVVTVGIDHVGFLGDSREGIGHEKAGIYRAGRPAVCADPLPPQSVLDTIDALGATGLLLNRDFGFTVNDDATWDWWLDVDGKHYAFAKLPEPGLKGKNQYQNMAGALALWVACWTRKEACQSRPIREAAIHEALTDLKLSGRFEVKRFAGHDLVLDVGHNPHAAEALVENVALQNQKSPAHWVAVCGMLKDKDREAVMKIAASTFAGWVFVDLPGERGGAASELLTYAQKWDKTEVPKVTAPTMDTALYKALQLSEEIQSASPAIPVKLCVFGSFVTVEAALKTLDEFGR